MAEDLKAKLENIISDLRKQSNIDGVAIARRDGLIVAYNLPDKVDPKRIAAMSAAIVGTSEMAAQELEQGTFLQSLVESEGGKILCLGAGEEALLIALVENKANLGLVLLNIERASKKIEKVLREA